MRRFAVVLTCLAMFVGSIVSLAGMSTLSAAEPQQKPYRLIFNCDGHASAKDSGGDLNQWIENVFGPLEGSQVDALFWCDGAGGNTANYDSKVLELTGSRVGKPYPWTTKWIAEGNDPPKVIVREAKKRGIDVYYSFRINDIHDSFMPVEFPTFKVEHPEWMIGEKKYGDVVSFRSSLNFAIPEVRDLKFRVVEEIFAKYDFDGLEIDFLRSTPYFLPGTESKNAHLLTGLLKRVRQHLIARGNERDKPIRLAVRIDENLKSCALDGFEVKKWLEEDLVDMLVLGSGVMDIEVEEFKHLAAPKGVSVYPCLYGWPSKYSPIPGELAAGLALNYWNQGADGVYLFNWFPHSKNNSEANGPYMTALLQQLGDPKALLEGQNKLMFAAERGRPQRSYQYNWLNSKLPAELKPGKSLAVPIRVGANLAQYMGDSTKASATLRIEIGGLPSGDQLEMTFNNQRLKESKRTDTEILYAISPAHVKQGTNQVTIARPASTSNRPTAASITALEIRASR